MPSIYQGNDHVATVVQFHCDDERCWWNRAPRTEVDASAPSQNRCTQVNRASRFDDVANDLRAEREDRYLSGKSSGLKLVPAPQQRHSATPQTNRHLTTAAICAVGAGLEFVPIVLMDQMWLALIVFSD